MDETIQENVPAGPTVAQVQGVAPTYAPGVAPPKPKPTPKLFTVLETEETEDCVVITSVMAVKGVGVVLKVVTQFGTNAPTTAIEFIPGAQLGKVGNRVGLVTL